MQRMGMQDQGQRRVRPRAMMVAPLQAAIGTVEDYFGHASLPARTVGIEHNLALAPATGGADLDRLSRQVVDPNPQPFIFDFRTRLHATVDGGIRTAHAQNWRISFSVKPVRNAIPNCGTPLCSSD
jgi:hypothetical protein